MNELTGRIRNLTPERRAMFEHRLKEMGLDETLDDLTARGETEENSVSHGDTQSEPIAIIGLGCRFPGGSNPKEFWNSLHNGVDCISEIPGDRWNNDLFYDPDPTVPGKMNTRWGGFISNVADFSPSFFRITPYEAERIDPQQRLLLEVAWEALESSGYASEHLRGSQTGVFIGISTNDYLDLQFSDPKYVDGYAGTGNSRSIAANRLSYAFDLRGPSFIVDTACSSSIVALHTACTSLREGECDMAIVGGVNLILSPETMMTFSQARMLSPDGRCKTFDASANGYVRGEGAGVVIVKRLSQALKDHDNVLAQVRGTALNQDGMSNGLTAPNGRAQQRVIREALRKANLRPGEVDYIEAHGTGTPLGDPIEVQALHKVLSDDRDSSHRCLLGSVKTNIGHTEAAAGMAAIIKAILCFQHDEIPPHLHYRKSNQKLEKFLDIFDIPVNPVAWPRTSKPRIIGINSFSFGGANAHALLEEPPVKEIEREAMDRDRHLLTLSARTVSALKSLAQRYMNHLEENKSLSLADVCFSANTGRSAYEKRLAVCVATIQEAQESLGKFLDGEEGQRVYGELAIKGRKKIVFLFTGQGSQYPDMGKGLYESHPGFRRSMDKCAEIARPLIGENLLDHIYPKDKNDTRINDTAITQPALFALEYSLAKLWISWGVEPDAVLGHSLGEYVAACIAGVFSLDQALQLVIKRARLMGSLPSGGAMAAVMAGEDKVAPILSGYSEHIAVAAYNGPNLITLSGDQGVLDRVLDTLEVEGINYQRLPVSHAFHSPLMQPMVHEFKAELERISYGTAQQIPLVSNVTGEWLKAEECCADYWVRHTLSPVRYSQSVEFISQNGCEIFLEVGPKATLSGMAKEILPKDAVLLPSLKPAGSVWETLLPTLCQLYINGVNPDWVEFDREYSRYKQPLPTYPYERQRCWLDEIENARKMKSIGEEQTKDSDSARRNHAPSSSLLDDADKSVNGSVIEFRKLFKVDDNIVKHHCIGKASIVPAAIYMDMALEAAANYMDRPINELTNIAIATPFTISESSKNEVIIALDTANVESGSADFNIFSSPIESDNEGASSIGEIAIPDGESYRLDTKVPGSIDGLFLKSENMHKLGTDDVEIEVCAAGLNFMDLMNVLGLLPTDSIGSVPLGTECAGKIVRVGETVRDFKIGDEVIASTLRAPAFSKYVVTSDALVVSKPKHISFEEAASIPTVFLTAYYSLVQLARLREGERVLIHSASGGVGLAAIQVAQQIGAEVFATAGNEERRHYLGTLGIGHVMNSRTDDFVNEIMQKTDGRGVDVVLNSLSGEFIQKSMSVLAPYGRFVEIGKTDIYNNSKLDLYPFRNNLSYFAVDLHKLAQERPGFAKGIFLKLADYFDKNIYHPGPTRIFPVTNARGAFRFMAQRKHIGKIVLTMRTAEKRNVHASGCVSFGAPNEKVDALDIEAIQERCHQSYNAQGVYEAFRQININYGPYYQTIKTFRKNASEGLALLDCDSGSNVDTSCQAPLPVLDGALQSLGALFFYPGMGKYMYVPFTIDRLRIYGALPSKVYCYVKATDYAGPTNDDVLQRRGFVKVCDKNGAVLMELEGVTIRRIPLQRHVTGQNIASSNEERKLVIVASSDEETAEKAVQRKIPEADIAQAVLADSDMGTNDENYPDYCIDEEEVKRRIKNLLTEKVAKYLRQDKSEISPEISLISLGLESLMAVDIVGQMNEVLGLMLEPTSMFEYSTIDQLTDHVYQEYGDQARKAIAMSLDDTQSRDTDNNEKFREKESVAGENIADENMVLVEWLQKRVKEKIARYLKQDPAEIPSHENLINLGLESLMAVDIISQFNEEFGLDLEPASMFEYPTVEELVAFVFSKSGELIRNRYYDKQGNDVTGNTNIDNTGSGAEVTYAGQLQMENESETGTGYEKSISMAKERAEARRRQQYARNRTGLSDGM